jgi:transcriptional antiterminator RfaH
LREWFLIYCKPRQEALAAKNLERQGYEVYLPMLRQRRRGQANAGWCVAPMFPRYLFIHLDQESDNWKPIRSTIGVSRMVVFGDVPARVPDTFVDALRAQAGENGIHESDQGRFVAGETVMIVGGPMAGYEAVFKARTAKERVVLLLTIAGRMVAVNVRSDDIAHLE